MYDVSRWGRGKGVRGGGMRHHMEGVERRGEGGMRHVRRGEGGMRHVKQYRGKNRKEEQVLGIREGSRRRGGGTRGEGTQEGSK